ncbi:MAG: metallophosphoesterase, partial [Candidatus Woesebacteria bacterium]|nr:metallophosphoesterase [Candidatus Woesebacteria bacterium]
MLKKEDLKKLIEKGMSNADIAEQENVNIRTVEKWKQKYGFSNGNGIKFEDRVGIEKVKLLADKEKSVFKKLLKEKSRTENIIDAFRGSIPKLPKASPKLAELPKHTSKNKEELILLLGDLHIGQKVDLAVVVGLGEYNFDIFKERLSRLKEGILKILSYEVPRRSIENLKIFCLGDMIEGLNVFSSQAYETEMHVIDQVINGVSEIADFILSLSGIFKNIDVFAVPGNHGVPGGKHGGSPFDLNFDRLFYHFVSERLSNNKNIHFNIAKEWFQLVEILGWEFLAIHGDQIKGGGSFPWAGWDKVDSRYMRILNRPFHYLLSGHYHTCVSQATANGERFCNGSFVGANALTRAISNASVPSQMLLGISESFGITF